MSSIDPSKFDAATNDNNLSSEDLETEFTNAKTDIEALETTVGSITESEADQIEQIDSVTISNAQWGHVGAMDQGVATTDTVTFSGVTVDNAGFKMQDSDASHILTLDTDSNLTAARTLKWNPGDADRTITINGDPTLNDWFDQSVKTTATPAFAGLTFNTFDPEHATDSGTDAFVSATNTTAPGDGVRITRDFQSANSTPTPTLDSKTITDRDGNALWAGAINGVHELQYASGTDTYLLLDPVALDANDLAANGGTVPETDQSNIFTERQIIQRVGDPQGFRREATDNNDSCVLDFVDSGSNFVFQFNARSLDGAGGGHLDLSGAFTLGDAAAQGAGTLNGELYDNGTRVTTTASEQVAQAWVSFDGTGTVSIRDHYNVSSITDNGAGDYTVNFDTNLQDANYAVAGAADNGVSSGGGHVHEAGTRSTSAVRIKVWGTSADGTAGSIQDNERVSLIVLGGN